jgi:hypothetical protein
MRSSPLSPSASLLTFPRSRSVLPRDLFNP